MSEHIVVIRPKNSQKKHNLFFSVTKTMTISPMSFPITGIGAAMIPGGERARIYPDFVRQASKRERQGGVWTGRGTEGPRWSQEEQKWGIFIHLFHFIQFSQFCFLFSYVLSHFIHFYPFHPRLSIVINVSQFYSPFLIHLNFIHSQVPGHTLHKLWYGIENLNVIIHWWPRWPEHEEWWCTSQVSKENKELRERIECVEKDARIRMLQRSVGQSHSRDSAIDTDLQVHLVSDIWWFVQDWETETLDIDMGRISNDDDLGLDLAGGR